MTLRRRGPAVVVVAVFALALAVTAGYALRRGGAPKPVASSTAQVVRGTVAVTASAAGTVSMVQTRGLSFATTGVVTELDVKVGDQVAAGQVLARIDATDAPSAVDAAQRQVNNAELALLQARQRLAGTVLTAPLAGRVVSVGGALGGQERPGGTGFIVLGNVSDTEVQAEFSEADVAHLAVGQPATITLANRTDPYPGKVAQISPAGTTSGRLVRYGVLLAFDTVPTDLLFGQGASVAVTPARTDAGPAGPSSAGHGIPDRTGPPAGRAGGRG